jgi:hypothetical protein
MHYWDADWHMWWMTASWVIGLAVLVAIVWLLIKAAQGSGQAPIQEPPDDSQASQRQHRTRRPPHDLIRRRSEEGHVQRIAAVHADHDQVGLILRRDV